MSAADNRSRAVAHLPPARPAGAVTVTTARDVVDVSATEARGAANALGQAINAAMQGGEMDDVSAELEMTQDGDKASLRMKFRAYRRPGGG